MRAFLTLWAASMITWFSLEACAMFTPTDITDVAKVTADTADSVAHCQELGRACQDAGGTECFAKYDACMADAGLR